MFDRKMQNFAYDKTQNQSNEEKMRERVFISKVAKILEK